jgi:hypothetical protein
VFEVGDEAVDLPADQLDNGYDPNLSNSDYDNAALGMDDIG